MSIDKKLQDEDCGVSKETFPCMGNCCRQDNTLFPASYEIICPYCEISSSLPCGSSLKITTIFECSRLGYGTRKTE